MYAITHEEAKELKTLERVVERGMATFVEVGNALKKIRDKKLYREEYKTFERYVQERWGFSKTYANNLINAESVIGNLTTIVVKPSTESQARELYKAPPEKRAEIWEEVVDSTPTPTAKDVKAAVEKHTKQQAIDAKFEVLEEEVEQDCDQDELSQSHKGPEVQAEQEKPKPTAKEQASLLKSSIKQHNAAMMRLVDDLQNLVPNKSLHAAVHGNFRQIHESIEAWK